MALFTVKLFALLLATTRLSSIICSQIFSSLIKLRYKGRTSFYLIAVFVVVVFAFAVAVRYLFI